MSTLHLARLAGLTGVASHLVVFIRGEWDGVVLSLTKFYMAADIVLLMGVLKLSESGTLNGLSCFLALNIGYWLGLFGSIALYRAFFHPLRSFPGPPLAKISALWSVSRNLKTDFNFHGQVHEMHQKYGDFVRIRPREISINNVDALRDIHGPGTVCNKGPWYDNTYPARSLQTTRDKAWHAQRRRVWDRGFTTKAIGQYMPRIRENCKDLITQLKKRAGTPVNASLWMSYFGFDVMGDLTFGKSFNMLKEGANAPILDRYVKSLPFPGVGRCAPWVFLLLNNLPIIRATRQGFIDWSMAQVRERRALGQSRIDLFTYILGDGAEETKTVKLSEPDLARDSVLAIIAGSDTTSVTLTATLYLLAKYPEQQKLLQEELDALVEQCGGEQPSYQMLSEAPFLNGCINEALRLYPPVQGGVQRLTPPNGTMIAGRFIPGDTIVSTPTYSLHKDPRSFSKPNEFIPTRWTPSSDLTTRKEAFNPFIIGTFSCVGKPLAWLEMRMAVFELLSTFNFRFAGGKTRDELETLFDGLPDYFTAHAPDLELVFEVRG
ncbi:cytochrome P450 [Aspergillus stella-maris]|uniref:cytochrome P450 n=1 Tax=Aspergillus stella-maris TaxID=1810926 RepID=UPI003CCD3ADC